MAARCEIGSVEFGGGCSGESFLQNFSRMSIRFRLWRITNVRKLALVVASAAVSVFGLAQVAGAQGLPRRGGFAGPGEGPGGPAGLIGGQRGCVPTAAKPCPQYQFTFTIKSMVPVLVGGASNTVPNTTTGMIAGDAYGDTYREVNLTGMGAWAAQGGAVEFIHVKNLTAMMDYIVNVTKGTYEEFPIHPHTPPANWQGKGPKDWAGAGDRPKPVVGPDDSSGYPCNDAETTSTSHNIQIQLANGPANATITTHRVYCPELKLVIEEDHSDPRFGTRSYQLSGYNPSPAASLFSPPFGLSPAPTLVQKKFGHDRDRRRGEKDQQPPANP